MPLPTDPVQPCERHPAVPPARLLVGSLSLLLLVALSLATGGVAGQFLTTATGCSTGATLGSDRALAPQIVERRSVQRQSIKPAVASVFATVRAVKVPASLNVDVGKGLTPASLLRVELLALPPPAVGASA